MQPMLLWRDPPPIRRGGRPPRAHRIADWAETMRELRQQPGRWAAVATGREAEATTLATGINSASQLLFGSAYEACMRHEGKAVYTVFARYAPGEDGQP